MNQSFKQQVITYVFGFTSALLLSVLSYVIVTKQLFESNNLTMMSILGLALVQFIIQLVCFLHLKLSGRSAQQTATLTFTLIMMLIIVVGSLWIMNNLSYRMHTTPEAMVEYMKKQNAKGF